MCFLFIRISSSLCYFNILYRRVSNCLHTRDAIGIFVYLYHLFVFFTLKVNLLAARNERESVQIAIRPKVSWGRPGSAGVVQLHCSDLSSASGNR